MRDELNRTFSKINKQSLFYFCCEKVTSSFPGVLSVVDQGVGGKILNNFWQFKKFKKTFLIFTIINYLKKINFNLKFLNINHTTVLLKYIV